MWFKVLTSHGYSICDMSDMMALNLDNPTVRASWDLAFFSEYCIHEVTKNAWFHEEWYAMLQDEAVRNGVIIAPRNSAKSTCTAKIAPLWMLGCNPDLRILIIGRTAAIAHTDLRFIKTQIESNDKVKDVFPYQRINGVVSGLKASSPWGRDEITVENNRHDGACSIRAVGLGGSISGFRADVIIVDDLIDHNNVMTEGQREKVDEFWKSIVIPTLNPGGRIFLIGTRYNNRDFYADIISDPLYKDNVHMFPALTLDDGEIVYVPRLDEDGVQMIDEEGEPMVEPISYWPERFTPQDLMWMKENMGTLAFTSQMLCDPSGYAGRLFDPEHLQYYDPERDLGAVWGNLEFVMTVDPNVTDAPDSDNMAVVTAAVDRKHSNVYILDMYAKPHDFVGQLKVLKNYGGRRQIRVGDKRFDPDVKISKIGIEAIAFQRSLQQSGYLMGLPIVEIKGGNMNKEVRILRLQPHIENGRVLFPDPNKVKLSWWDGFYEEYCTFPRGRRDDRLDALEMLIDMMGSVFGQSGIPWGPTGEGRRRVWSPDKGRGFMFGF